MCQAWVPRIPGRNHAAVPQARKAFAQVAATDLFAPEASGVETVLAGLRTTLPDDDLLLREASVVFDALIHPFEPTV